MKATSSRGALRRGGGFAAGKPGGGAEGKERRLRRGGALRRGGGFAAGRPCGGAEWNHQGGVPLGEPPLLFFYSVRPELGRRALTPSEKIASINSARTASGQEDENASPTEQASPGQASGFPQASLTARQSEDDEASRWRAFISVFLRSVRPELGRRAPRSFREDRFDKLSANGIRKKKSAVASCRRPRTPDLLSACR